MTQMTHWFMKKLKMQNKLIIGIGNETKGDDGLGWAFLDLISTKYPDFTFLYNYQLGPEDGETISHYDWVLIVDASYNQYIEGFNFSKLTPSNSVEVFTHSMRPDQLLYLSSKIFGKVPKVWLLEISGYKFEFGTSISNEAMINLHKSANAFQLIQASGCNEYEELIYSSKTKLIN